MAAPRSRGGIVDALAQFLSTLKARDIGIKGFVFFDPDKSSRSRLHVTVQDDHEREVIEYQITVKELEPATGLYAGERGLTERN